VVVDLAGRVALVTGGSGDLGSAICLALARRKVDVAVAYVEQRERAERVVAGIEGLGCRAVAFQLDQSDAASTDAVVAAVEDRFGRLDVLVNNATWNIGIPFTDLEALDADIWDRMYATNLRGLYLLARAAARPMRTRKEGRIVTSPRSVASTPRAAASLTRRRRPGSSTSPGAWRSRWLRTCW